MVEYMEEELQGEGAGSKATRVQQWNLNIEQRIILDRVYIGCVNDFRNCGQILWGEKLCLLDQLIVIMSDQLIVKAWSEGRWQG